MTKTTAVRTTPRAKVAPIARVVQLSDLVPDPTNTRSHPERSKAAVAASLKELGAGRSIVVDASGVVRAGNGTLEAARAAGITEAVIVETDGKRLVVVKRPDWTPEQALAYAIADNRTSELSHFDHDALRLAMERLAQHAVDTGDRSLVDVVGFNEKKLAGVLAQAAPTQGPGPGAREVSFTATEGALEHECPRCKFKF